MRDLIQPFAKAARTLVRPDETVLVAVSGGADSLALLDLTARAGRGLRARPIVVHLDHGWRPGSGDDARFVRAQGERLGLPVVVERVELPDRSEATARAARLAFFARCAAASSAAGVLLGHSADDQAETVLLHLLRGSGAQGLGGMRAESVVEVDGRPLRLLRPLLGVTRAELAGYCRSRGLEPRRDPTNQDQRYLRNRVRGELLPVAEAIAPGATLALARAAAIMAAEAEVLAEQARAALGRLAAGGDSIALERKGFRQQPPALQRAILREIGRELLGPAPELGLERIEAARAAILGRRGGAVVEWPGLVEVRIERGEAIFSRRR
ncbi:MAG TPA: tRNA lysidine(34) synthetase TilS [Chloroflexota bacterium]|jgi:tRNA(Ile)-lysidine synthase|nr:tRNA lysidine(34) synthetase TilS [Chloroflexota bacterium]